MMRRVPRIPANLTLPGMTQPWHVWVMKTDGKWQRGRYHTYADAFKLMKTKLADEHVADVSIVSIRWLTPPPIGFRWKSGQYPWCPRCRRPSLFQQAYDHRALPRDAELTYDEPMRCFYCGIRQAAFPRYSPR